MNRHCLLLLLLVFTALLPLGAAAADDNPLPNPGFENGETGWQIRDADSKMIADAARTGKLGLRIGSDKPTKTGSHVTSARFAVTAGQQITVTAYARADKTLGGVYLLFQNDRGQWQTNSKIHGGFASATITATHGQWQQITASAAAPEGATTVALWIHSYSSTTGFADVDDVVISGLTDDVKIIPAGATQRPKPLKPIDLDAIPSRDKPAVIIIKLDDLRQQGNSVHPRWKRVAEYLQKRGIKATMGMICQTLEQASPQYVDWVKQLRDTGNWEFWFHGYDHGIHQDDDGHRYNEFSHRSYDEQKKRFDDSQQLAQEKLGFAFKTFGPPGGTGGASFDANTIEVMQNDPHMTTWLYPQPLNAAGKQLESRGKIVILDRVWDVNLEGSVGVPDFDRFVRGYIKHMDRPYFVLQGHPAMWNDARFAEFAKIIDFLVEHDAVFVLPSEYAATLAGNVKNTD